MVNVWTKIIGTALVLSLGVLEQGIQNIKPNSTNRMANIPFYTCYHFIPVEHVAPITYSNYIVFF